jgi:hypothetical protein
VAAEAGDGVVGGVGRRRDRDRTATVGAVLVVAGGASFLLVVPVAVAMTTLFSCHTQIVTTWSCVRIGNKPRIIRKGNKQRTIRKVDNRHSRLSHRLQLNFEKAVYLEKA